MAEIMSNCITILKCNIEYDNIMYNIKNENDNNNDIAILTTDYAMIMQMVQLL